MIPVLQTGKLRHRTAKELAPQITEYTQNGSQADWLQSHALNEEAPPKLSPGGGQLGITSDLQLPSCF